ncbi:hypothetical protein OBBRIDRAFT_855344 [Obba rivulosa]|uniref:Uncharacterized protein n=1 Tax=Obba rivulosa TaxID=1052685 RepID=A0A8E2DFT3_9APHY|nr:hypothetical protein OBBRIDRAFT_855344 [Obba rivulosa]
MSKSFSLSWMGKKPKTSSRQRSERAGSPSASNRPEREVADPESTVGALYGRASARKGKSPEITPALKRGASARRSGWLLLKKTLETIRDGSDHCLPLKVVLVGVVAAMEIADNVKDARGGFLEIARKIEGFQGIFAQYESADDIPPIIQKRLERLSE